MAARSDIVVVGAGVVGCSIACELARRGASVEIVDDRPAGMGATQASAGVLAPYIEARQGHPLFELTIRSLELFDAFVEQVRTDADVAPAYRRTGTLEVALDADAMRRLEAAAAALHGRGVHARLLDAAGARSEEPHLSESIAGGLFVPVHGYVAAADLTRALIAAARRHGAQLIEHGRVRRIVRAGSELRVETDRGSLTGDRVVIAAGSWSGQIAIEGVDAKLPIRPVRGQLLHLAWSGPTLRRVVWSDRCYLVPWENGTLLVGATVEDAGFDETTTTAGVRDLIEGAAEVAPHTWTAGFIAAKAGLRPATPDEVPIIGPSTVLPGLVYATGHYRNGVLLAPLTAQLVADAILDSRIHPLLAATSPGRFGSF